VFTGFESLHLASQVLEAAFELVQVLALIADLALEAGQLAGARTGAAAALEVIALSSLSWVEAAGSEILS
jgi:hypothetical protein